MRITQGNESCNSNSPNDKISETEYLHRVEEIHQRAIDQAAPDASDEAIGKAAALEEFQALIDLRLGRSFPSHKREALAAVHLSFLNRRNELNKKFLSGHMAKVKFAHALQRLVQQTAARGKPYLSNREFQQLYGAKKPELVSLPIDVNHIP